MKKLFFIWALTVMCLTSFATVIPGLLERKESISLPSFTLLEENPVFELINKTLYEKAYQLFDMNSIESDYSRVGAWDTSEYISNATVTFITEKLVSFKMEEYLYNFHAAHGKHLLTGLNFDISSGREIVFESLFVEESNYREKINQFMLKKVEEDQIPIFEFTIFNGLEEKTEFYLTEKGIIIFFQEYAYTPYFYGQLVFEIPYEYLKEDLKRDLWNIVW